MLCPTSWGKSKVRQSLQRGSGSHVASVALERSAYTVGQHNAAFSAWLHNVIYNKPDMTCRWDRMMSKLKLFYKEILPWCNLLIAWCLNMNYVMAESLSVWCLPDKGSLNWLSSISLWGAWIYLRWLTTQELCQESDKMSEGVKQMPWQVSRSLNTKECEVNLSAWLPRSKRNISVRLFCHLWVRSVILSALAIKQTCARWNASVVHTINGSAFQQNWQGWTLHI